MSSCELTTRRRRTPPHTHIALCFLYVVCNTSICNRLAASCNSTRKKVMYLQMCKIFSRRRLAMLLITSAVSKNVRKCLVHTSPIRWLVCVLGCGRSTVNGPCLLDYLILKLRLPVVLYVSFAVVSR